MDDNIEFVGDEPKQSRSADFKARSVICDQEKRRLQLLTDQKRKREQSFNVSRKIDLISDWENEDDLGEEEIDCMEWTDSKPKPPRLKDLFMFSEWMGTIPEDLEDKWMFVLCPVGKRCLVRCAKGSTSVFGKRGQRLAKFQSALPNGSQRDISGCRYSNSEVTILDCIWCSKNKCYFILDLLSWKGQLYMDTETSFRVFWIKSKLEEVPSLSERSEWNTYPFLPLDYYPCDLSTISTTLSKQSYFTSNSTKIDGILFYHSEAYYTPGSTPLVLWLKPFMLPEVLNMTIPEMYSKMKPSSYVDKEHYIVEYETKKMKRQRRNKKGIKNEEMEEDPSEVLTEEDMIEET